MIDIDKLLEILNINQLRLSKELGVSSPAISLVRKGDMRFPKEWKNIIKERFNVDVDDFIITDHVSDPSTPYSKNEVTQVSFDDFMEVPVVTVNAQSGSF